MVVAIRQDSKIGNIRAEIGMSWKAENGQTTIDYNGEQK